MSTNKAVVRVSDSERQQLETYLYWQSLPIGDRLSGVWDVSEAAYSFAAAFKGVPIDDAEGSQRLLRAFNEHGVRYLIVGGYALVFTLNPEQQRTSISSSGLTKRTVLLFITRSPNTAHL